MTKAQCIATRAVRHKISYGECVKLTRMRSVAEYERNEDAGEVVATEDEGNPQ